MEWEALPGLFPDLPDAGRWLPLLERHAELVARHERGVRVTAVPAAEAVRRQYAESLEVARVALSFAGEGPVADVGSGGGFPGMVLAAVFPGVEVHLIEPLQKRARLLQFMARDLDLGNVRVHALRAEEAGRGPLRDACTVVTARAVAELRELLEYTAPLAGEGGVVLLPKGSRLADEEDAARAALDVLACRVESRRAMAAVVSASLSIVLVRKVGPTPERYPRRPGMAAKRPL